MCGVPDGFVRVDDILAVVHHYFNDKVLHGTATPIMPTPDAYSDSRPARWLLT